MSALPSDDRHYEPTAAELIAADLPWVPVGRSRKLKEKDGSPRTFFIIPSRTVVGSAHYTNRQGCTCKGFLHRGKCAHVEAVRLYETALATGCD